MHIINLTIECKDAIGDGTKIVCMNSDYVVRINAVDCGTFSNAPVKKLIIRHDKEYYESPIEEVMEGRYKYLQAVLPPLERKDYVDLGVCGRNLVGGTEVLVYTSKSARFLCDKSALCGTAVFKTEPVFTKLYATENDKTYTAAERGVDGFYSVDVHIPVKLEESRTVDLNMSSGNQTIIPTYANRTMTDVIITKPMNFVPENIRKGVNIAGVVGSFEVEDFDGTVDISSITDDITEM